MAVKLDKTIKLDHLITLSGFVFALGVFYAMMMQGLQTKAEKSAVMVHEQRLGQHDRDIDLLRVETSRSMSRIEGHLARIESKIDQKADKQ